MSMLLPPFPRPPQLPLLCCHRCYCHCHCCFCHCHCRHRHHYYHRPSLTISNQQLLDKGNTHKACHSDLPYLPVHPSFLSCRISFTSLRMICSRCKGKRRFLITFTLMSFQVRLLSFLILRRLVCRSFGWSVDWSVTLSSTRCKKPKMRPHDGEMFV